MLDYLTFFVRHCTGLCPGRVFFDIPLPASSNLQFNHCEMELAFKLITLLHTFSIFVDTDRCRVQHSVIGTTDIALSWYSISDKICCGDIQGLVVRKTHFRKLKSKCSRTGLRKEVAKMCADNTKKNMMS